MWVVLSERVLKVFTFSSWHPSGELAILTFAGKGASVEFDMIHLPDVIERCVLGAITGIVGSGKAKNVKRAVKPALSFAWAIRMRIWKLGEAGGRRLAMTGLESSWRNHVKPCYWLTLSIIRETCAAIFSA